MTPETLKALVQWILENHEADSAFLSPYPCWSVMTEPLLERIAQLAGIGEADMETLVEDVQVLREMLASRFVAITNIDQD